MDYRDYNDYELLYYISENNEEANDILYKKYEPLIKNIALKLNKTCCNIGLELEDLVQEGRIGLDSAINTFSNYKDIKFLTYAKACIERKIISALLKARRQKHQALNGSCPYEVESFYDDMFCDGIFKDEKNNPEKVLLDIEKNKEMVVKIMEVLTDLERQVFELRISGFSYNEISKILEKEKKVIDNAIQRIRIKIKEQIK